MAENMETMLLQLFVIFIALTAKAFAQKVI
jgi:hypothetical protein